MDNNWRNRARVAVPVEALPALLRLPDGVKCLDVRVDTLGERIEILLIGPDLELVPRGAEPPLWLKGQDVVDRQIYELGLHL